MSTYAYAYALVKTRLKAMIFILLCEVSLKGLTPILNAKTVVFINDHVGQ